MEAGFIFLCLVALLILILVTLFVIAVYSGLFETVNVGAGPPPIKNVTIAYKFARGPYKNAGSYFTEITSLVPQLRCIGVYYDDPKAVPSEKLRWAVGAILAEGDKEPNADVVKLLRSRGFKLFNLPSVSNAINCAFPFNTYLSIFIAIFRVYPLMGEYARVNKLCAHPYLEIYQGYKIHFMAPLAKQDEFYVPETSREEGEAAEEEQEPLDVQPSTSGMKLRQTEHVEKTVQVGEAEKVESPGHKTKDTSFKTTVTDSSGKRSRSEELSAAKGTPSDTVQDSGISSTASASFASDTSMSPSPKSGSPASPATSASSASATMSETSVLTTTDASSCVSTEVSQTGGTLSGFSSESSEGSAESFEVVKKEDAQQS